MTKLELLDSGYGLLEGPRYNDGKLFFSDVTKGGVYCLNGNGRTELVVPKRRGVGGIALHEDGGLVITGRNVCHVKDGVTTILFDEDGVGGFNDLFTDLEGRVLVGSLRSDPFGRDQNVPGELYRIGLDGKATVLYEKVHITNGIGFSPNSTRIYHSDSGPKTIIAHDVTKNGELKDRKVFATLKKGLPDGLAVDELGCVWVANYDGGGIDRFTPEGELDFTLDVPSSAVTSLCFGGPDRRDLFIVTADNTENPDLEGSIFQIKVETPGLAVAYARIPV